MKNSTSNNGIGFGGLLAIVFITLKLTKVIDWSWWWVTAPLWIPVALIGMFALFCLAMHLIQKSFK